jgi:hypothetical protein
VLRQCIELVTWLIEQVVTQIGRCGVGVVEVGERYFSQVKEYKHFYDIIVSFVER